MTDGGENPETSWLERNVRRFILFLFPRDPSKPPPPAPAWSRFYQRKELPIVPRILFGLFLYGMLIYLAYLQLHQPQGLARPMPQPVQAHPQAPAKPK